LIDRNFDLTPRGRRAQVWVESWPEGGRKPSRRERRLSGREERT
jgi:hypothetical protein